ncbi:SCO family protein [Sphaerotilus mobilis]|uniref:Cytochrome oxidase Cu insertion factor (SCO1/SenC/PrrC family) n=1 Tax=Sphaerotilus mobilis TaxID=47994 RepID=A0A4Q7LT19_9BURK|nr:SCO family protein [Sphaerotilus mobilis]RZS58026.1 cytochrome oxidase Cu insertion factor (SCO1/SenC/PrrC family) [Sphaerotilus mobilis]
MSLPLVFPRILGTLLTAAALLVAATAASTVSAAPSAAAAANSAKLADSDKLTVKLPDVEVLDQEGRKRRFGRDLVAGKRVAINFIFTSCTTICSPLSATFKAMDEELRRQAGPEVQFISISVDPLTDTPAELRKFGRKFDAGANWTFVTGSRASIDAILKAYDVGTGNAEDHSPMVWLGHEPSQRWVRTYGLASHKLLVDRLTSLDKPAPKAAAASAATSPEEAAALDRMRQVASQAAGRAGVQQASPGTRGVEYFTNLPLVTQERPRVRFYDDLIRNRVVLITSFYASCKDVCSPVTHNLARVQEQLQDSVKTPVQLISITTDSGFDTPEVLRDYAERHSAGPGWSFVTGKKENVDWVLHKLGLYNEKPEQHTAVLWVGNDRTGAWLKLHALAPPEAIVAAVRKVL